MGLILTPREPKRRKKPRCKTRRSRSRRQGALGSGIAEAVSDSEFLNPKPKSFSVVPSNNSCKRKLRNRKRNHRRKRRDRIPGDRFRESLTPQPVSFIGTYTNKFSGGQSTKSFMTASNNQPLAIRRCWDRVNPGPPYYTGGPLTLVKGAYPLYDVQGLVDWYVYNNPQKTNYYRYSGGFAPVSFPWSGPTSAQINALGLSAPYSQTWFDASPYGAEGYRRAAPTLQGIDGATAIGELKDLPHMLHQTAGAMKELYTDLGGSLKTLFMSPKHVADHFINHVFGWVPFVSDVTKAYNTYQNQNKMMDRIEKDNGNWKHSVRRLVNTKSVERVHREYAPWVIPFSDISHMLSVRNIDGINCRGYLDVMRIQEEYVWFEGVFKFYLAAFDRNKKWHNSRYGQLMRLMQIYGLRVSPVTIYKLTPWSWLLDWFTNIGQQLDYLRSTVYDGRVSKYAYIMRTRTERIKHVSTIFPPPGYDDCVLEWNYGVLTKDRKQSASPFGFSLSGDLSARQLTILSALGISKGLS
jgi:hypothetical protein